MPAPAGIFIAVFRSEPVRQRLLYPEPRNIESITPPMATPAQKQAHFQALLDYFQTRDQTPPRPIAHPDETVRDQLKYREKSLRRAAVLIPVTRENELSASRVVLTVRSANLKSHAGQISLPGGSWEQQDQDSIATALRESEEEIGLQRERVEVIGELGKMALPSGFHITPVVGVIDHNIEFVPCPIEVADIFSVPLELVLDRSSYRSSTYMYNNAPRKILELLYEDYRIWGATAAILYHLACEVELLLNGD